MSGGVQILRIKEQTSRVENARENADRELEQQSQ